ncbi:LytTR family DNA-binding domain-containing protein [Burkholderiaceae bacterium DAT-1]|nr:LytTR family DNA-binding domain-containing protein [Burkholderiaceae bacterium DAT-1]
MNAIAPTALIADDERLMRDQLRMRLGTVWPELQIISEAANGREAIAEARACEPDIVFLDIRMPEVTGIEAAKVLARDFHVVFVTAYDEYAIEAFEQGAVDYVLKPADPERLEKTCERLKARLVDSKPAANPAFDALLGELSARLGGGSAPRREYLRWIQANVGNSLRMINTNEILFFRSDEKYTRVQTESFEALIRKPIKELIDELDPDEFWQIHRSTVVRVEAIKEITRDFSGRQIVHVHGHGEKLEVSRNYTGLFKHM